MSEELPFTVDLYDPKPAGNRLAVLARVAELDMARAAYKAASERPRDGVVFLRHGARVISRSDRP